MRDNAYRGMIESVVTKAIRELSKRSKRELRNLVELGTRCARGRFQDDFFRMARHMLADDNSPYYDMIFRLVKDVEAESLGTFAINVGYNSWCMGAKRIRAYEQEHGYNVPWTILCDLDEGKGAPLSKEEFSRLIAAGRQLGIYCYCFFSHAFLQETPWLCDLFSEHKDCAFLLFTGEDAAKVTVALRDERNVLPIVCPNDAENDGFSREIFCGADGHFAAHGILYDETNADAILDWYERGEDIKKEQATILFLLRKKNCPERIAKKVNEFTNRCKAEPKQPLFLLDFYEDVAYVDRVISTESCFLKILRDGSLVTGNPFAMAEGNLREGALTDLLQRHMPKVNYSLSAASLGFSSLRTR